MKKIFLIISLLLLGWTSNLMGQGGSQLSIKYIDALAGQTSVICDWYFSDDGTGDGATGQFGNYQNNKEYVATLCANSAISERLSLRFDTFDIHPSDTLWIHEGQSVTSPLFTLNGANAFTGNMLAGKTVRSPLTGIGCLTLRFKADAVNNAKGFFAYVSCDARCQYPVPSLDTFFLRYAPDGTVSRKQIRFDIDVDSIFDINIIGYDTLISETTSDDGTIRIDTILQNPQYGPQVLIRIDSVPFAAIDICAGDSVALIAKATFPENDMLYHQSDSTCWFYWSPGDRDDNGLQVKDSILGSPYFGYKWAKPWGYNLTLTMKDTTNIGNLGGCTSPVPAGYRVRISENPVRAIANPADMCSGTTQYLIANYSGNSNIQVDSITHPISQRERYEQLTFIPDGPSCDGANPCYRAPVTFDKFTDGATLLDPTCLNTICINMEHSFIGDFTMEIFCPNGQSAMLKPKGGGGTYLGLPADYYGADPSDYTNPCTAPPNIPGTGWTYCFSENLYWDDTTCVGINGIKYFNCNSPLSRTITTDTNIVSSNEEECYMFVISYDSGSVKAGQSTSSNPNLVLLNNFDTVYLHSDNVWVNYTTDSILIKFDTALTRTIYADTVYVNYNNNNFTIVSDTVLGNDIPVNFTINYNNNNTDVIVADTLNFNFQVNPDALLISYDTTITYRFAIRDSITVKRRFYMNDMASAPIGLNPNTPPTVSTNGANNTSGSTIDSTSMITDTSHYILPWQDYSSLVGCPLNGTWIIQVCDTWAADNGFIFWWDMELGNCPGSGVWDYTTYLDSVLWDGPFMSRINETTLKIAPPVDTGGFFRYSLHLVDNLGCVWDTATFINIIERPVIDLGPDVNLCEGETFVLNATHRNATDYLWSNGSTNATLSVTAGVNDPARLYSVSLTNNSGAIPCTYNDSIKVTVKPQALASIDNNPNPLEGCEPFTFQLFNTSSNVETFEWRVGDEISTELNPTFTFPYGNYDVTLKVTSADGCQDSVKLDSTANGDNRIHVYAHPLPDFAWEPNNPYATAPSAQMINLTQPDFPTNTYRWIYQTDRNNPNNVQVIDGKEPIITWQAASSSSLVGDYDITLYAYTNSTGTGGHHYQCVDSIKRTITIVNDNLIFPNVVTPNGDGINDIFIITNLIGGQAFPDNELTIYNRYGRMIYIKEDLRVNEDGWDPNKTNTPDGTYFFRFIGRGPVRDVEYTGTIEVLRGK
ncbi:MAG: gliding motility-associated C-terminal domain-containing protein [Bacteroidales bacterium]|jgi:gliding motility-associated-like protein|nr:gliding motility-associated C-terminal domain-containing protein [Bacteroidales bacterium]